MAKGRAKNSRRKKVPSQAKTPQNEEEINEAATASNRIFICGFQGCNDIVTTGQFCRFHYLATWKQSKQVEAKQKGQKLEAYLQDLATRFPEDFLERLKGEIEEMSLEENKDDSSEKSSGSGFFDDSNESNDADVDTIIRGIRVEDY